MNNQDRDRDRLADQFASLFDEEEARESLSELGAHTRLPTFNLSTTSLRHLNMWFDRLYDINQGVTRSHGNYFSDPASIGLVSRTARPRVLTQAGHAYLAFRNTLRNNPMRAEYEILKILYFGDYLHTTKVNQFLAEKRDHLSFTLEQFRPTPSRHLFLTHPRLLVVSELISGFRGAIPRLIRLPESDLLALESLGEEDFNTLCHGQRFPHGLSRLCRRIGGDYTRAGERRLHYLLSMALLTIADTVPSGRALSLSVPTHFSNLLSEIDIYNLHAQYTSDINVWFDGLNFQVTSSLGVAGVLQAPPVQLQPLTLRPQTRTPSGRASAPPTHQSRRARRSASQREVTFVINAALSERSEDVTEERVLRPQYGMRLIRVGHRSGETIALPDGIVPGADFYVLNSANDPVEFIEIKSVAGNPPFEVAFTRAEYLRAVTCSQEHLTYRLILVDVGSGQFYEVSDFTFAIAGIELSETLRFFITVCP